MKKLLLSVALAFLAPHLQAGDDVVAFSRSTSVGVLRSGGNLYRPSPRGGSISNLTASERYRAVVLRPTQHFYLKDNVVSYRYSAEELSRLGSEHGGNYHGPHAAQFIPSQHQLAPHGRLRTYAAVNKRPQPGVPMISSSTRIRTVTDASAPVTRLQLAEAK
jgi:hypothetical protein